MAVPAKSFSPGVWPVVGHGWAVQLLQQSIELSTNPATGRGLSHAYLFLGPPQVGKATLAHAFAQALLCEAASGRPCGACRACALVQRGVHPDLRFFYPLDKDGQRDRLNGELRAEQAADLIREVALHPNTGRYRIFVLYDMHRANASFANRILKTLEEPASHAILLLTAWDRASLLPTLVSRCQVFELRPLELSTVEQALQEGWGAPPEQAQVAARLANGRLGWAVGQIEHPDRWAQRLERLTTLWRLMAADRLERLQFAEAQAAQRNSQQLFGLLETWTSWWRDILLAQAGCLDSCSNGDQRAELERQAQQLERRAASDFLATLRRSERYLHHTVNTRLTLDVLLLKLPACASQPSS
jgi:DNA polymerase-3 subunit delta'